MLKAAGGGAIVNLSSAAGRFGYAFRTPYSAAKWGVIGFTQSLAKELGPANIRVNAILPGIVEGPRMTGVIAARAKQTGVTYEAMEKTYLDRVSLAPHGDRRATSPPRSPISCRRPGATFPASRSASTATSRLCEVRAGAFERAEGTMSKVAIVGSGLIGRAWAISFARAGYDVALWDQDPEAPGKALAILERLLPDLEENDLLNGETASAVAARMRPVARLEEALDGAAYVQENTPEDVEVKRADIRQARRAAAPQTILASSTSAILPSDFHRRAQGPGALPRRPSDQSAISHPGGRGRARALDRPRSRRAHRGAACAPPDTRRS